MSFEMGHGKHEIELSFDHRYGLEIVGLKCPYEEQIRKMIKRYRELPLYKQDLVEFNTFIHLLEKMIDG